MSVIRCGWRSRRAVSPDFLTFKSYTADDGEVIALSEWLDEASARAWGREEEHAGVQARGRAEYYPEYTLFAGAPSRIHRFKEQVGR